jgi:hypothetical protein
MRIPVVTLALLSVVSQAAADTPPDVGMLVARMKAALEPPAASVRLLTLTISAEDGGTTEWSLAQARKTVDGQPRILNVVLAPAGSRGITSLIVDGTPPKTLLYVPAVRRVRTLVPLDGYETVLGSDFTYFDLGFVRRQDKYTFVGAEQRSGRDAWKIEQTPSSPWYYSRIVTWIDRTTSLPLERDYYGPSGQLWKVETFDKIVTVDGRPVALKVTMRDRQTGGTSVIDVSKLRFGVDLPDALFERAGLRQAADSPIWAGLD